MKVFGMKKNSNSVSMVPVLSVLLLFPGCGGGKEDARDAGGETPIESVSVEKIYVETGDLAAMKKRGRLRILAQRLGESHLPREGYPLDHERELAAGFAGSLGLKPILVYVDRFEDLIPSLEAGKGDLVAANLTVTGERKERISFTVPVGGSREQAVGRSGERGLKRLSDLRGRTLSVQKGTSFLATAAALKKRYPEIEVRELPGGLSSDEILDGVAAKKIDLTIEDSNVLDVALKYRSDVKPLLTLTKERPLAWGVRKGNPDLLDAVNRYLEREELTRRREPVYKDDLPGLKRRKTLRVLTRNNAATYFLWRGELMGFEFELAREFARKQGLRVEVVVAPSFKELIPMLKEGKGDLIAAFMTITGDREADKKIAFSRPYHYAREMVVAREDEKGLEKPEDLKGRTLVVRRFSSYWETLEKLKGKGVDFEVRKAPPEMETEEIIERVAEGTYDLTLADGHILDIEKAGGVPVKGAFPAGDRISHGWAVRAEDRELLAAVNEFWEKEYRGLFYNMRRKKYFQNPRRIGDFKKGRVDLNPEGGLSPYDAVVKRYADRYGFDWRLLVSQMYRESRFDPKAKSWAGAKGLMQLMPRTAAELGFKNLEDPETAIHAGVKYLDRMRERFSSELAVRERIWFALASYNAGAGHVLDARRLAREKGWDPDRWFGNVERAMLLLSKPQYAKNARHGYIRGEEPVNYVREIRDRYNAYAALTEG